MDVLPRITRQLVELFQGMSPVQRATFVAVPLLIVAGLGSIVVLNRPDDHQAVLFGRTFTTEELANAEKALNHAGLLNYRREDRKLVVPGADLDRYNAALVEFDAVPPDLGSQILKQFESLGPFSTDRHRQEMKDALLLQELRRMIKSVPDIEDARVAVANSGRRVGFGQKPRVTANVTVKPRAGRELSARLVGSLRQAVASMVPDLQASDVTVFDVARGQAFTGDANEESFDSRLIQRVSDFTRQYEQQIQKALAFIPHATVAVHVDLDNLKSSVIRQERVRVTNDDITIANRPGSVQQVSHEEDRDSIHHSAAFRGQSPTDYTREVSERELLAAMPRAVQVSVSIPRDYYRHVAMRRQGQGESNKRRLDLDSIEEEILTKVERTVGRLIPVGSPHDAISVTTIDQLPLEASEATLSTTDQLTVLAWKHGGSWGLGLFAVVALWMLSRIALSPSSVATKAETAAQQRPVANHSPVVPEVAPFVVSEEIAARVPAKTEPVFRAPSVTTSTIAAVAASTAAASTSVATATTNMRDEVLALAQSDPATTAAVLSQWLAEAR